MQEAINEWIRTSIKLLKSILFIFPYLYIPAGYDSHIELIHWFIGSRSWIITWCRHVFVVTTHMLDEIVRVTEFAIGESAENFVYKGFSMK